MIRVGTEYTLFYENFESKGKYTNEDLSLNTQRETQPWRFKTKHNGKHVVIEIFAQSIKSTERKNVEQVFVPSVHL